MRKVIVSAMFLILAATCITADRGIVLLVPVGLVD